jgi:sodium/potassium-transporting ATPase subunit alpha
MKRAKVLCKSLSTVETLGCVDVILSDKTGTLTTNRMTVVEVFCGLERKTATALVESGEEKSVVTPLHTALAACCALNNDATYEDSQFTAGERNVNGDATDSGLLRFSDRIFSSSTARLHWNEIYKLAFNSSKTSILLSDLL